MRAALPHMEPYLRETKLEVLRHLWCGHPWNRLSLQLASPGRCPSDIDPLEYRRLCVDLWKELMPVARRVLASKGAARVQDHALYFLASWTEPPQYTFTRSPVARRNPNEVSFGTDGEVSSICKHRLELLETFAYLKDPQNLDVLLLHLLRPPWGRREEPAYQEFLTRAEKLPNEELPEAARVAREGGTYRPRWMPKLSKGTRPPAKPPVRPPAKVVANAEVVFHPVQLTVVDIDGKEHPFTDSHGIAVAEVISWIKTAEGIDAVLGHQGGYVKDDQGRSTWSPQDILYLMKDKGRLIRLPLKIRRSSMGDPTRASGMNLCWDGRFLWIASPGPRDEGSDATASPKRFLAAIDPHTLQIVKLTADDGLPPMIHPLDGASAAVTALAPGKVLVAGYFGRSWCGIATFSGEKKIALDVFFEAPVVYEEGKHKEAVAKTVAFPIRYLCTLNPPAGAGQAAGQRVLLGRVGSDRPPLLVDPEKRSVEVLSEPVQTFGNTSHAYSAHDGGFYWYGSDSQRRIGLHRIGFPDFRQEHVNPSPIYGPFLVNDNRVYVWCKGQLYMAPSFREPFAVLPGNAPEVRDETWPSHLGLSHHYGMVAWTSGILNLRSIEVRFH